MDEIIIVGASVAGAATAWHLARFGHSVHLIDKDAFPRRKVCGEGVLPAGVDMLGRMGILEQIRPRSRVLTSLLMRGYGASVEAHLEPDGYSLGVKREVLDGALINLAESEGVRITTGVVVLDLLPGDGNGTFAGIKTTTGDLRGSVVIAADGLGSRLRRAAGLHLHTRGKRYGVSAHFELGSIVDASIQIYFERDHEVYITPVGESLVNVALLLNAAGARELGGALQTKFEELVRGSASMLEQAALVDAPMAAGPFPSSATKAWQHNMVLAGDAAGFFDGITGEGMSIALVSAEACALAVHRFLEDGDGGHFATYGRRLNELRRPSLVLGRLNLALAARPALGRRALMHLARHPDVLTKLIAVSQGRASLGSLRPRDAIALLTGL